MSLATSIKNMFARKADIVPSENTITLPDGSVIEKYSARYFELNVLPYFCGENYLQLFESVPEVFFPINFIASRIAGATFEVKRVKDDSIVYYRREFNKFLDQPNCLMKFRELVYLHFVYKLATGNAFLRSAAEGGPDGCRCAFRGCLCPCLRRRDTPVPPGTAGPAYGRV